MASVDHSPIAELTYDAYQERQLAEITAEQLLYRANQLRKAEHFAYSNGQWNRLAYEGYAVVSVVDTNPGNDGLSDRLQAMQQKLLTCFDNPAACFLLPAASFHQTVANTLSADRFHEHILGNGLANAYPSMVSRAFDQLPAATESQPIVMRLIGLSLFSSAIGILGTFDKEADYDRILQFREHFYANEALSKLTVRRTRPFIGHITLAYLGAELSEEEKGKLVMTCADINEGLRTEPLYFALTTTELRSYPNLAHFETKPGYPVYSFVNP